MSPTRNTLPLKRELEDALSKLEWNVTNPYHGVRPFDPKPFLAVIGQIALGERERLVLRKTCFYEDGMTTFTEADQHYSEIRVEAINRIFELYYDQIARAYRLAGFTRADFDSLKARSRAYWHQNAYLTTGRSS